MIKEGRKIAGEVKIPQETLDVPEFEWGDDEDERIKNAQKTPEEIQAEETGIMQDSGHDKTKKQML